MHSSAQFSPIPLTACILLIPTTLTSDSQLAVYLLPLAVAIATVLFVIWLLQRKNVATLTTELKRARALAQEREQERDVAQDELFRRLYEERELNKDKVQFQSQLAEYEKYAALAQLALGAAHEINNPLLGILSHLELELKVATDPEQRQEIEQCIAGAKRISSTLHGLVNYARPGPLVLSKISLHRLVTDTLAFIEHQPMTSRLCPSRGVYKQTTLRRCGVWSLLNCSTDLPDPWARLRITPLLALFENGLFS